MGPPELVGPPEPVYQLTHDSLVAAVSRWRDRRESTTAAGRAVAAARVLSQSHERQPHRRHLPSPWQYLRWWPHRRAIRREPGGDRWWRAATKHYAATAAGLLAAASLIGFSGFVWRRHQITHRLSTQLMFADVGRLPETLREIDSHGPWLPRRIHDGHVDPRRSGPAATPSDAAVRLSLIAPSGTSPSSGRYAEALAASPLPLIRLAVDRCPEPVRRSARQLISFRRRPDAPDRPRLLATLALMSVDPTMHLGDTDDAPPDGGLCRHAGGVIDEAIRNRLHYPDLVALLRPARERLACALVREIVVGDDASRRSVAEGLLRDLYDEPTGRIAAGLALPRDAYDRVTDGTDWSTVDIPAVRSRAGALLRSYSSVVSGPDLTSVRDRVDGRLAALPVRVAAAGIAAAGIPADADDPSGADAKTAGTGTRRAVVDALVASFTDEALSEVDAAAWWHWLHSLGVDRPGVTARSAMAAAGRAPEAARAWATLAIGVAAADPSAIDPTTDVPPVQNPDVAAAALAGLRPDAPPRAIAAAYWLARRVGGAATADRIIAGWVDPPAAPRADRAARASALGHLMVMVPGGTLSTAPPFAEGEIAPAADPLPYPIEVAVGETTVRQYRQLIDQVTGPNDRTSPDLDAPVGVVPWHLAVEFCQRLSRREGMSDADLAYQRDDDGEYHLRHDFADRAGYRLPTAAEWNALWHADPARAAAVDDPDVCRLVARFGPWSGERTAAIGIEAPDALGLFAMPGNHMEWCSDRMEHLAAHRSNYYAWTIDERDHIAVERWAASEILWRRMGFRVVRSGVAPAASSRPNAIDVSPSRPAETEQP